MLLSATENGHCINICFHICCDIDSSVHWFYERDIGPRVTLGLYLKLYEGISS